MSDVMMDADLLDEEMSAEPAPVAAPGGRGVLFAGRYRIEPTAPIAELSTPNATAYPAEDLNDTALELYALVLDPAVPHRNDALLNARSIGYDGLPKPVRWGQMEWPPVRGTRVILVLPKPAGARIMSGMGDHIRPWTTNEIVRNLLAPMVEMLVRMGEQRVTHRNIRPTNLYQSPTDGTVVSGEFYSCPAGYNQPAVLEPIERAVCLPAGRGAGEAADDLFALGATALMLLVGRNPVADLDDRELNRRRIEMGSYVAILGNGKLPPDLVPVIRSLMRDDIHERWTIADLAHWIHSGRVNPAQPVPRAHSDRPFELNGETGTTTREVANILALNWTAALEAVRGEAVERWVDRSLKDRELAKDVAACRSSQFVGPRTISDDLLLARTIITLDPSGPLRFRGLHLMPDGIGPATAGVVHSDALTSAYRDMLTARLVTFWHEKQERPRPWMMGAEDTAGKLNIFLGLNSPGYGVERCLYEANIGMTCRSDLLGTETTTQPRELLEILDRRAGKGGKVFDRHIAAFLAARVSGNIDKDLNDLASAKSEIQVQLSQARMFAYVQSKHGPSNLQNLYALFVERLSPMLADLHNVGLRKRVRRDIDRHAAGGVLSDLLRLIDSDRDRRWDQRGFANARKRFRSLDRAVRKLEDSEPEIPAQAQKLGRQIAANFASLIGVGVVVLLLTTRLG